ncbi:MAG: hypothetical protein J6B01_05350 [Ruminococcus sp.]|nr:hypothetical protein [Ruminococcus sp.]
MKNKILSVVLSGLLLAVTPVQLCTNAAENDNANTSAVNSEASVYTAGLITGSDLSCTAGSKTVYITATVYCNEIMSEIGFRNIKIQRSSDKQSWTTEKTIPDQISEDTSQKKLLNYSVSVQGGYYYRIFLDNYAKENTWLSPEIQYSLALSRSVWVP